MSLLLVPNGVPTPCWVELHVMLHCSEHSLNCSRYDTCRGLLAELARHCIQHTAISNLDTLCQLLLLAVITGVMYNNVCCQVCVMACSTKCTAAMMSVPPLSRLQLHLQPVQH
jgi:hypothetical protein